MVHEAPQLDFPLFLSFTSLKITKITRIPKIVPVTIVPAIRNLLEKYSRFFDEFKPEWC